MGQLTHWPDRVPTDFPQARQHAAVILEAVHGDYQSALDVLPLWVPEYGQDYVNRLLWLLTPKGEA